MMANIFPPPLTDGALVAIASPASAVRAELFGPAIDALKAQGWRVQVMPHAMERYGSYSADCPHRLADMQDAIANPNVRAIICGRGGYGSVHLLESLYAMPLDSHPKWLVGFSDISALHALWRARGIVSLHAPMIKDILGPDARRLFDILRGEKPQYTWDTSPFDRPGCAYGELVGGNLSVLSALADTPFDVFAPGKILFIEDINEPIYKIERMLWQLRLRGILPALKGLIVGDFTGTSPDANHHSPYEMIAAMVAPYSYPVAMRAPIGHGTHNIHLLHAANATLHVTQSTTHLDFNH